MIRRIILLTLLIAFVVVYAGDRVYIKGEGLIKVTAKEEVKLFAKDYNRYDRERLIRLADSLLNGTIDTSLSADSVVIHFLNTSRVGEYVKYKSEFLGPYVLGLYSNVDSTFRVNSMLRDKKMIVSVMIHELVHFIQINNGFYTSGRKTWILNEIFADHIAAIRYKSLFKEDDKTKQSFMLLGLLYLDKRYDSKEVLYSYLVLIDRIILSLERLE